MSSPIFFDPTNLLALPRKIINTWLHADWRRAKRHGAAGVLRESISAATGWTMQPFFVPTSSTWDQERVHALLLKSGIESYAYGYWAGEMHFDVKRRQAHWAQYVMLRAGVPLLHGLLPGSRALPPLQRALLGQRKPPARHGFFDL